MARWAARLDVDGGMGRAGRHLARGTFRRTWTSTGLPRASCQPACEACCRTAPRPTLATPRERAPRRAGMSKVIAQMKHSVKNKGRTLSLTHLRCHPFTSSPGSSRGSRSQRRSASQDRDGRDKPGHDREGVSGGDPDSEQRRALPAGMAGTRPARTRERARTGERARTRKGYRRVIPGRALARARKPSPLTMQDTT